MRAITTAILAVAFCAACERKPEEQWTPPEGANGIVQRPGVGIPAQSWSNRPSELSGGTLTLSADGTVAAISDPDTDRVVVMELADGHIKNRVQFYPRTRPGRATLDGDGNFAVALRGSGEVATVSSRTGGLSARRSVCSEPVGLAYDRQASALIAACATGELAILDDGSSTAVVTQAAADLREVVVENGKRWVTTFRSAQLVPLAADQSLGRPLTAPINAIGAQGATFVPAVGWRARGLPGGGVVLAHQRHVKGDIAAIQTPTAPTTPAYYTNPCTSPIVRSAVTVFDAEGTVKTSFEVSGALPVDIAVSPDGSRAAVVLSGSRLVATVSLSQASTGSSTCSPTPISPPLTFEPIAAAYRPDGTLVVQSHNPPELVVYPADGSEVRHFPYGDPPDTDVGYAFFHASVGGLACASCHPEGRDDGHTWTFTQGAVRTQSLAGGLSATAPYHWKGNLNDLPALLDETFVLRMGGLKPEPEITAALAAWLDEVPAPGLATSLDGDAVARGKTLFGGQAGCSSCHWGALFTDARTTDVGTGGRFQVPSLKGLRSRGPWMHDGCAKTLADRFNPDCGGTSHGTTSTLDAAQRTDLISYLESL
jgi:hypothetical protein